MKISNIDPAIPSLGWRRRRRKREYARALDTGNGDNEGEVGGNDRRRRRRPIRHRKGKWVEARAVATSFP